VSARRATRKAPRRTGSRDSGTARVERGSAPPALCGRAHPRPGETRREGGEALGSQPLRRECGRMARQRESGEARIRVRGVLHKRKPALRAVGDEGGLALPRSGRACRMPSGRRAGRMPAAPLRPEPRERRIRTFRPGRRACGRWRGGTSLRRARSVRSA
jgi:hypothetical protein